MKSNITAVSTCAICLLLLQACSSRSPKSGEISQPSVTPPESKPSSPAPGRGSDRKPAPPPFADEDNLESSLKRLRAGNLAYSTPQKMKTGETGQVTARIANASVPATELTRGLPGQQTKVVESVKVSTKMKMTLTGSDFTITALSPVEQFVDNESATQWQWDIKPNRSGKLHLRLAAVVQVKELSKEFTTIDREIAVQVDPLNQFSEFWKGNWQWIIATLTALGGGLWKWLKSRTKSPSAPKPSGAG